jgi:hypothetical protein
VIASLRGISRELKHLTDWKDGRPGTELNFKFIGKPLTRSSAFQKKQRRSSASASEFIQTDFPLKMAAK